MKDQCQGDQADNGREQKGEVNPLWEGELEFEEMARRWSGANWESVCRGQLWAECCVPPATKKVICWKPNPICRYQEVGCLGGDYVITRGTHDKISALVEEEETWDLLLHKVRTQQEGCQLQTRKTCLPHHGSCPHLHLGLPDSWTVRATFLSIKPFGLQHLSHLPEWTKAVPVPTKSTDLDGKGMWDH